MEKLLSTKTDLKFVPESYILPTDSRPGTTKVPFCETIAVIDFKEEPTILIHQIIHACKEFGFFQLINHGVGENLLQDVLEVTKEYFKLPAEDKAILFSDDLMKTCKLFTSIDYMKEQVHYWRDALRHPCHPLEEHIQFWPQKPANYREVIISNGKLKGAEHRVVTNQKLERTKVASFIFPSLSCQIEPAKVLIKDNSPPLYGAFTFKDFLSNYIEDTHKKKTTT
ncbi:Non-heme dioxygenase N-terminal domain containing protein [Trema orientale]|uniref:Non-heme dioxygenase N-terminal domain containing protein n=1 Tax=Trema orientale TaxID=63057 RepID=A0A2P5FBC6_TREOI|nr:Non-heme dioxygenase N-terminal domain containing protein [Trema orientale]